MGFVKKLRLPLSEQLSLEELCPRNSPPKHILILSLGNMEIISHYAITAEKHRVRVQLLSSFGLMVVRLLILNDMKEKK